MFFATLRSQKNLPVPLSRACFLLFAQAVMAMRAADAFDI